MSEKKKNMSFLWEYMKYSERIIVYEADVILYSILWAKQGDLVPTENTVSEELILLMPHESQEFPKVLAAGQAPWAAGGSCFPGADPRSQQNHQHQLRQEQSLTLLRDI